MAGGAPPFAGLFVGGGLTAAARALPEGFGYWWYLAGTISITVSTGMLNLFIITYCVTSMGDRIFRKK